MDINAAYLARLRWASVAAAVLAALAMLMGRLSPAGLNLGGSDAGFIHLLMEMAAIVVAVMVMTISLHTFNPKMPRSAHVLIAGFLIVSVCDIAHTLATDVAGAQFFWLMGRSFGLATMASLAWRWRPVWSRPTLLVASAAVCAVLLWLGSRGMGWLPAVFVSSTYLPAYEYALSGLFVLLAIVFWRRALTGGVARDYLLALSAWFLGLGEYLFAGPLPLSDFQSLVGHGFKPCAYFLVYWATFINNVRVPLDAVRRSEQKLRESEARLRSLSDHLPGIMMYRLVQTPDNRYEFLHVSEGVKHLYGIEVEDALASSEKLYGLYDADDRALLRREIARSALEMSNINMSLKIHRPDGSLRWIQLSSAPHRNSEGQIIWDGVHIDITERTLAQQEVARLGFYDELTGLPNRRLLMDRLGLALASSTRTGRCGALMFMDLDHFKNFNDSMGHDLGDDLLHLVALRLAAEVRGGGMVSRFGGDEFVVVLEDLNKLPEEAAAEAQAMAERLQQALREPLMVGGQQRFLTISIGISLFGVWPTNIDEMMQSADLALYRAKSSGRNTSSFFDPQMQTAALERAAVEADLRRGLENDQFVLHYQPQVEDGRITGVEALVRWNHPDKGLVSPARFIPVAEDTGLIVPLGDWVLQAACKQLAVWSQSPATAELSMAINVSVRQFRQSGFVEQVLEALRCHGARADLLKIELTESLLAENVESIILKMTALQQAGVSFALDDFGTGYSSLSYLKRFPLAVLKIDQSFVRDILEDPHDAAIAKTIIALGQSLGLMVIAEGVEEEGQRAFLAQHGCQAYQGYLFYKPMPIDQLGPILAQLRAPAAPTSPLPG